MARSCRGAIEPGKRIAVLEHGVDLPGAVGAVDPDLVLLGEATGAALSRLEPSPLRRAWCAHTSSLDATSTPRWLRRLSAPAFSNSTSFSGPNGSTNCAGSPRPLAAALLALDPDPVGEEHPVLEELQVVEVLVPRR